MFKRKLRKHLLYKSKRFLNAVSKTTKGGFLILISVAFIVLFSLSPRTIILAQANELLEVSSDGRWLIKKDSGEPFFLIADSAWRLHSLSPSEQNTYFQDRQSKGFTAAYVGLTTYWSSDPDYYASNANGDKPFNSDSDCLDWNNDYFEYFSEMIERAASYDIYIIIEMGEPTDSRRPFFVGYGNTSKAKDWGEKVGHYFKNHPNIIFVLGQDRDADEDGLDLHRAVAEGLVKGVTGQDVSWDEESSAWDQLLLTYHPSGGRDNSSDWFHKDEWLDFNGIELWSGSNQRYIYDEIRHDYSLSPTKPTFLIEGAYEDRTKSVPEDDDSVNDYWIRYTAYNAFFSGGCGTSYGHTYVYAFPSGWQDNLDDDGVNDMLHLRNLIVNDERPFTQLELSDDTIQSSVGSGFERRLCLRAKNGEFLYVYLPRGGSVEIDMSKISPSENATVVAQWYNPRNGLYSDIGEYENSGNQWFTAPDSGKGNDYVLVLIAKESVSSPVCSSLTYPTDKWQRVWYDYPDGSCLGNGPDENDEQFNNDWQYKVIAYGKEDDIQFSSSRRINFSSAGDYRFTVGSDDGIRLWIDNDLKIDSWADRAYVTDSIDIDLSAGYHDLRIDYYESKSNARVSFSFTFLASSIPGDLDGDGDVDIFDLVIVGNCFGLEATGDCERADANNSGGTIDIFDLVMVGSHFGEKG